MIKDNLTGDERIKAAFSQLNEAAQNGVIRKVSQQAFNYAQDQADTHTKTGALARSTYIRSIRGGYAIGHDERMAPHAKFVHWGTKPHLIKHKDKQALRWAKGGKFFFSKSVNHPGYKGHPWLEDTLRQLPPRLDKAMQQEMNRL